MTSRERVLKAINFEEPDRVPMDLGAGSGASGIHVIAYNNLKKHLGLPYGTIKSNDIMQQLAVVEDEVLGRLHIDSIPLNDIFILDEWHEYGFFDGPVVSVPGKHDLGKLEDGSWLLKKPNGEEFIKPASSCYFDAKDGKGWYGLGVELTDENLRKIEGRAKFLYENTEYAISFPAHQAFMSNHPDFLMDLISKPEEVEDDLNKKCDALIEKIKLMDQAVGKYTHFITMADDFGTQAAPMISPDMFREKFLHVYKRFTDWLHKNTALKFYLHSCGAVEPLIPYFIEMGVDILNPVQTSAAGMEPEKLKEKYGGKIVFWGGGCDTQSVLGFRPTEEVIEHVKQRIKIFAPGGGFVFNPVHAIQALVKPEDIVAIYDTVYEFGKYPLD